MSVSLRPYQAEAATLVSASFAKGHKRVILCLPTGAGKTVVFSDISWKAFVRGKKVLIITHRRELLKQAGKTNNCEIMMVETLYKRIKKHGFTINQYDLTIIDEAHIGSFRKILEHYDGYVIGATATPIAKIPLKSIYDDIVCNVDIPTLISQGYLSRPKTFVKTAIDVSELKISGGEFSEATLDNMYNKPKMYAGMVDDYVKHGGGVKAVVFCVNIQHTINVYMEFKVRGIEVHMVHSNMKEWERDLAIEQFTKSKNGVLINASIATTGFDVPDIRLVIIDRATMSVSLWLQMCGRGSRIIDAILAAKIGCEVKFDFNIWDYGENIIRLGHWEAERDWTGLFFADPKKKKNEQPAPVKECEQCKAMIYASARKCPHCGYEFPEASIKLSEGELREILYRKVKDKRIYDLSYEETFQVAQDKKWPQGFVERLLYWKHPKDQISSHDHPLQRFWDSKNYKPGYRRRKLEIFEKEKDGPKNFLIDERK